MDEDPDIDRISARLNAEIQVSDHATAGKPSPVDDDGPWFVDIPGRAGRLQIESRAGSCPFLIESDFTDEKYHGSSVDDVVAAARRSFS